MSDLQLEQNQTPVGYHYTSREILGQPKSPKVIKFLIEKKIVKSEKQAGLFVLSFIILIVVAAVLILLKNNFRTATFAPDVQRTEVQY